MISSIKDIDDKIVAYIEWEVVNHYGQFQEQGEYIYIQDLWIHEMCRGNGALNKLIAMIDSHDFTEKAKYVYWLNLKHNEKFSGPHSRKRLSQKGENNGKQV